MDKLFEETKIKLVMKIRGCTRDEAGKFILKRTGHEKHAEHKDSRGKKKTTPPPCSTRSSKSNGDWPDEFMLDPPDPDEFLL